MDSYCLMIWVDGSATVDTWSNRLRYDDGDPYIREIIPLKYFPIISKDALELRGDNLG